MGDCQALQVAGCGLGLLGGSFGFVSVPTKPPPSPANDLPKGLCYKADLLRPESIRVRDELHPCPKAWLDVWDAGTGSRYFEVGFRIQGFRVTVAKVESQRSSFSPLVL